MKTRTLLMVVDVAYPDGMEPDSNIVGSAIAHDAPLARGVSVTYRHARWDGGVYDAPTTQNNGPLRGDDPSLSPSGGAVESQR